MRETVPMAQEAQSSLPINAGTVSSHAKSSAIIKSPGLSARPSPPPQPPTIKMTLKSLSTDSTARQAPSASPAHQTSRSSPVTPQNLCRPLPSIDDVAAERDFANATGDIVKRVRWARSLFRFIERTQFGDAIDEPSLVSWIHEALHIIQVAVTGRSPTAEALYLRAQLAMSGAYASLVPKNPQRAFRDFEAAANGGYAPAWFRIGQAYETFKDEARARHSYEMGARLADPSCICRLGIAYLLGHLNVKPDISNALELLRKSATSAYQGYNPEVTEPLFIWGMILSGEFEAASFEAMIPPGDIFEARKYIRRAAYLGHVGAQHRLGQAFEYAQLRESYDPNVSVQYYSLASQQGHAEADLALSKWFLCGAEGYFDANENLAFAFAKKAADRGLAAGKFALGYYYELGIGTNLDLDLAKHWYRNSRRAGNVDAQHRLETLDQGAALSRADHGAIVNDRLMRKHTLAQQRATYRTIDSSQAAKLNVHQTTDTVEGNAPHHLLLRNAASFSPSPSPAVKKLTKPVMGDHAQISVAREALPRAARSPMTFAEMGIESTRLKKEECTVM